MTPIIPPRDSASLACGNHWAVSRGMGANSLACRRTLAVRHAAERQTERGDEFPERPGRAVNGMGTWN